MGANKEKTTVKTFTVWVGGVEVNDFLLTKKEAEILCDEYSSQGYDDVIIENIKN
jgi:hypothetical protein